MKKESISGCCEHHSTVSVEPQDENEDCLKSIETEKCQFPDSATSGDRSPMKENDVSEQTNMLVSLSRLKKYFKLIKLSAFLFTGVGAAGKMLPNINILNAPLRPAGNFLR